MPEQDPLIAALIGALQSRESFLPDLRHRLPIGNFPWAELRSVKINFRHAFAAAVLRPIASPRLKHLMLDGYGSVPPTRPSEINTRTQGYRSVDARFNCGAFYQCWLVERCGDVIGAIAIGLLKEAPRTAWKVIPVSLEKLGNAPGQWPRQQFGEAFTRVRKHVGSTTIIGLEGQDVLFDPRSRHQSRNRNNDPK
jgi:hypothetical protein